MVSPAKARGRPRAPFPPPLTEGQRMLQTAMTERGLTFEMVAHDAGVQSAGVIQGWTNGVTRPAVPARARLWAAYEIPSHAWNQRHYPAGPQAAPPASSDAAKGEPSASTPPPGDAFTAPLVAAPGPRPSTLEQCYAVLDSLRAAALTPNLIASERIKLADSEGRMLALRAKLERDAERGEDRIVREHPEWARLCRLIVRTLSAHPAALKDLTAALGGALDGTTTEGP